MWFGQISLSRISVRTAFKWPLQLKNVHLRRIQVVPYVDNFSFSFYPINWPQTQTKNIQTQLDLAVHAEATPVLDSDQSETGY